MPFKKRLPAVLMIALLFMMNLACISYGNSAEPPSILIIVPDAPYDLEISIGNNDSFTKAKEIDKKIEKYYIFYPRDLKEASEYTLSVKSDDLSYEIVFEKPLRSYQNVYTLNLESRTLTPGKSPSRSIVLISSKMKNLRI